VIIPGSRGFGAQFSIGMWFSVLARVVADVLIAGDLVAYHPARHFIRLERGAREP
jgi:hypothetical protein